MLRKMCRECAPRKSFMFSDRILTGEVVRKERVGNTTFITLRCGKCGHEWTYEKTKYK